MCILVLTRDDGTLFDVTSIEEKDIMEICICLGHTHPESVLQYSAVKLVMLFHSADEMQVLVTLCKEPIKDRASPPSATHVRAYMVVCEWGTFRHSASNPW